MVDGKYEANVYAARPPEEMEVLKAIVLKAVGFNAERGDQIEVANIPFTKIEVPAPPPNTPMADLNQWARSPMGMGVIGGGVILLFFLLKLIFKRRPTVPQEQLPATRSI
jgi:flagellar M-ring protein FliF